MLTLRDSKLFQQLCFIDGTWSGADSDETIEVTNPASGEKLGTIPKMGASETRRAIEAANRAYPLWRAKTAQERCSILRQVALRRRQAMLVSPSSFARMTFSPNSTSSPLSDRAIKSHSDQSPL